MLTVFFEEDIALWAEFSTERSNPYRHMRHTPVVVGYRYYGEGSLICIRIHLSFWCQTFSRSFVCVFKHVDQLIVFRAHRTNDLTKILETVGLFECDELAKHCRVCANCYPTKIPALYTMAKEKFNVLFLVLLLVSRQSKRQLLLINELVPIN